VRPVGQAAAKEHGRAETWPMAQHGQNPRLAFSGLARNQPPGQLGLRERRVRSGLQVGPSSRAEVTLRRGLGGVASELLHIPTVSMVQHCGQARGAERLELRPAALLLLQSPGAFPAVEASGPPIGLQRRKCRPKIITQIQSINRHGGVSQYRSTGGFAAL